jgi:hypothetical protein
MAAIVAHQSAVMPCHAVIGRRISVRLFPLNIATGNEETAKMNLRLAGYLGVHWDIARRAVKAVAIFARDSLKAFWDAIYPHVPRMAIRLRKHGYASLSAMRTSKIFNPMIADNRPVSIRTRDRF